MPRVDPNHYGPKSPPLGPRVRAWFFKFPRWLRWGALVAILCGLGLTVTLVVRRHVNQVRESALSDAWERFEKAARQGDEAELRSSLEEILTHSPGDERAMRYRTVVESGESPADDASLCYLTTILNLRRDRWSEAAREAAKRIALEPNDWLARCILARSALIERKPDEVQRQLEALPDPSKVAPTPSGLLMAYELYLRVGRDPVPLRRFVNDVLVEVINSVGPDKYPVSVKIELIECYLIGFSGPNDQPLPERLSQALTAIGRLADQAEVGAVETRDAAQLTRLGVAGNRLGAGYDRLRKEKKITLDQYAGLVKQHESRAKRIWKAALDLDRKNAIAHHGLAIGSIRSNRLDTAFEQVRAGLIECPDSEMLLGLQTVILRSSEKPEEALKLLLLAAQQNEKNINFWLLLAETALDFPRRDIASAAVEEAMRLDPKNQRALRLGARLKLIAGDANGAAQQLRELGEETLLNDPQLARAYVLTLIEAGLSVSVPGFLEKAEARSAASGQPGSIAFAIRGLFDARFDSERHETAITTLDRLLFSWPGNTDLLVARAIASARLAELGSPVWETKRTQQAILSLERVRAIDANDLDVAAMIGWIRLKGSADAPKALRDVEPILSALERGYLLTQSQATSLGAAQLANGNAEGAVKALELGIKQGPGPCALHLQLALAYRTQGRSELAAFQYDFAQRRPRTAADEAELLRAKTIFQREKP